MGTIWNDSILFDCWEKDSADRIYELAKALGLPVCAPIPQLINGGYSVAVLPDGSKLGWVTRTEADEARQKLKDLIETEKISTSWIHVRWGECGPCVVDSNSVEEEY